MLAAAQLAVERPIEALSFLKVAHARVEKTGERWFEAELYRLSGDALLWIASGDASSAEASFAQAIAIAQRRGAKWWELRAVTSLARLWAAGGERGRAVDLLAPVYGWFTEGLDTPDLGEARALARRARVTWSRRPGKPGDAYAGPSTRRRNASERELASVAAPSS